MQRAIQVILTILLLLTLTIVILTWFINNTPNLSTPPTQATTALPAPTATSVPPSPTSAPSLTPNPTATALPTAVPTPTPLPRKQVWIEPIVPQEMRDYVIGRLQTRSPSVMIELANEKNAATADLSIGLNNESGSSLVMTRTYAVAAPFLTVADAISQNALQAYWRGDVNALTATFANELKAAPPTLLMSNETRVLFERGFGPLSPNIKARMIAANEAISVAQTITSSVIALLPFNQLDQRWKLLWLDGQNLFDKQLDPAKYPFTTRLYAKGDKTLIAAIAPFTDRDPAKMTVVAMTGVTAMARGTAVQMEAKGLLYPGLLVRDWLRSADITHISNEVSFWEACPAPSFAETVQFCSRPKYIELLKDVGTDVVELTGNHLWDFGWQQFSNTLKIYDDLGWQTFGGGRTYNEALKPLTMTVNGNNIAFIGCNWFGANWATDKWPGSARCGKNSQYELDLITAQIREAKAKGYLVIATIQYEEYYTYAASPTQRRDFQALRDAGAIIVNGSQGHHAQGFNVSDKGFIHYGTGNLFFGDQFDVGAHQTFVDRHVFYNGTYLGVELKTAYIDDYSQPRPMRPDERAKFLRLLFALP